MDAVKFHLLLNYYPAIFMVAASLILFAAMWRRSESTRRLALELIILSAFLSLTVALAGEYAGKVAATTEGPRAEALRDHRIAATAAFVVVSMSAVSAAIALVRQRRDTSAGRRAAGGAAILAVAASALLVNAIFKGRALRYVSLSPVPVQSLSISFRSENKSWHV